LKKLWAYLKKFYKSSTINCQNIGLPAAEINPFRRINLTEDMKKALDSSTIHFPKHEQAYHNKIDVPLMLAGISDTIKFINDIQFKNETFNLRK
jgi:hypothetical protein